MQGKVSPSSANEASPVHPPWPTRRGVSHRQVFGRIDDIVGMSGDFFSTLRIAGVERGFMAICGAFCRVKFMRWLIIKTVFMPWLVF